MEPPRSSSSPTDVRRIRSAFARSALPPSPSYGGQVGERGPRGLEETPCNLCGGRNEVVVGARDPDGHPLRTVLCRTCGLVWTNPRPSAAAMNAYYETTYRSDYKGQAAPPLRKIVRGFSRRVGSAEDAAPVIGGAP